MVPKDGKKGLRRLGHDPKTQAAFIRLISYAEAIGHRSPGLALNVALVRMRTLDPKYTHISAELLIRDHEELVLNMIRAQRLVLVEVEKSARMRWSIDRKHFISHSQRVRGGIWRMLLLAAFALCGILGALGFGQLLLAILGGG